MLTNKNCTLSICILLHDKFIIINNPYFCISFLKKNSRNFSKKIRLKSKLKNMY